MDGTLHADDEAELLHTLSVSPEKRGMLRDFMQQKALLTRDREAMAVPYEAEQSLWAKVDAILPMPVAPIVETAPVAVPVGFLSRLMSGASAAVGAAGLLVGLGIGYFATLQAPKTIVEHVPVASSPVASNNIGVNGINPSAPTEHQLVRQHVQFAPLGMLPSIFGLAPVVVEPSVAPEQSPAIATVQPVDVAPAIYYAVGEPVGNPLRFTKMEIAAKDRSLLQRFEFHVSESFGRQFPNTVATNVSLPLITNSSVGAYFQVLPHSNTLWAGAAYGSASVTKKELFARVGNPVDPLQYVLAADTSHVQSSYIAALAQLRFPAFAGGELTFTGGYGFAAGQGHMMIGELGLHYDVSSEVGIVTGLRMVRFSYDLASQRDAAIANRTGSLVVPNGIDKASPSINTELNTGLYFHF